MRYFNSEDMATLMRLSVERVVTQTDIACLPRVLVDLDESTQTWGLSPLGEQVVSLIRKQSQEVYDLVEQVSDLRHGSQTIIKALIEHSYNPDQPKEDHPPCSKCGQPTWQGACAVELFSENTYLRERLEQVLTSKLSLQIELDKIKLSLHETAHPATEVQDIYDMVSSKGSLALALLRDQAPLTEKNPTK